MKNQRQMVIDFIDDNGSITPLDAIREFGITRLASRVYELKKRDGIELKATPETSVNRYGKKVTYARYSRV